METVKLLDALDIVITDLQIKDKKCRCLKLPLDLVSCFFPKVGKMTALVAENRDKIEGVVDLGNQLYRIASAKENGGKGDKGLAVFEKAKCFLNVAEADKSSINPESVKKLVTNNPSFFIAIAALTIVEKDVKTIIGTTKDIISFLEEEKESEIEADVKTLSSIIGKYGLNCDNATFVNNNYKMVLDIQRTARKNMLFYEKRIRESLGIKLLPSLQSSIEKFYEKSCKNFDYYKMAVYVFSLSSFLEIILGGNYAEENVSLIQNEIEAANQSYVNLHLECMESMQALSHKSVESNAVKGMGILTNSIGKLFAKSKKGKASNAGEKMQTKGSDMIDKSAKMGDKFVDGFQQRKDSGASLFVEKIRDMVFVYNRTGSVCLDKDALYFVED